MTKELPSLFERLGGREALRSHLDGFYRDVRADSVIGPIFAAQIDDWPVHMEKITDFWSGVTGGPRLYTGAMPFKHVALNLEYRHFEAWLALWDRHARANFPEPEGTDLSSAAHFFGERIRQVIALHARR